MQARRGGRACGRGSGERLTSAARTAEREVTGMRLPSKSAGRAPPDARRPPPDARSLELCHEATGGRWSSLSDRQIYTSVNLRSGRSVEDIQSGCRRSSQDAVIPKATVELPPRTADVSMLDWKRTHVSVQLQLFAAVEPTASASRGLLTRAGTRRTAARLIRANKQRARGASKSEASLP